MLKISLTGGTQFVVPLFAETASERSGEELIESDAFLATKHLRGLANFPLMIIYRREVRIVRNTHGI